MEKAKRNGNDRPLPEAIKEELPLFKTDVDKTILAGLLSSHNALSDKDLSTYMFNPKKDFGWDKVVVDGFDQIIDGCGITDTVLISNSFCTVYREICTRFILAIFTFVVSGRI